MNLPNEYTLRHSLNCIPAVHEGLLFFAGDKRVIAVHTALRPKVHSICPDCDKGMAVEIYTITDGCASLQYHLHILPDQNIVPLIKNYFGVIKPVSLKGPKEIELFLWQSFHASFHNQTIWKTMRTPGMNDWELMFQCTIKNPNIFNHFINTLTILTAGRKYILNT